METKRELDWKVADVARRMNVTPRTVRNLCDRGELPYTRIGGHYRFDSREIEAYIEASTVQPQPA